MATSDFIANQRFLYHCHIPQLLQHSGTIQEWVYWSFLWFSNCRPMEQQNLREDYFFDIIILLIWGFFIQAQPSASSFSFWYSCLNWLTAGGTLSIFFLNAHLLPLFFGLFILVTLLIDGSVEGQYISFRTFLSILANLKNDVVWKVYAHPLISKPSSHCTIQNVPITVGMTVIFICHSYSGL